MKAYKENEDTRDEFYNKNPEARNAAKQRGGGGVRGEKEIMSIVGTEEDKSTSTSNAVGGGPGGEHASLFDGPDLALQRKLERDASKKE